MSNILNLITNNQIYIILGLGVLVLILIILIIVILRALSNLEKRYRKFMRGANNQNIEELITDYLDKIDKIDGKYSDLGNNMKLLDKRLEGCFQKSSILRYRAFEDVGSDLSFSLALLNADNNGVLLTGIYGRTESTTYAKPIDKGISRYELSEEEDRVLRDAISK